MKALTLCTLLLTPLMAWSAPGPDVLQGPHYTVTSWAGREAGQVTLDLMEALVTEYNSLFSFDLGRAPAPWNVTLYANKADFDAALAGQVEKVPEDYVYLHYSDPTRSQLVAWVPAEVAAIDEVKSLAFQGFFQFLWTFLPRPPAWIETGLATVFWNSQWDGKVVSADPDLPYLEDLQARWKETPFDVEALLKADSLTMGQAPGLDLEAWALAAFLLQAPDPSYARVFGSALTALSPTASVEENRNAVTARFQAAKDMKQIATDVQSWWMAKVGFRTWMDEGRAKLKGQDPKGAAGAFREALGLKPHDDGALYYWGLASYEAKDYGVAEEAFSRVNGKALPPGLLAYARGLTAFAQKKHSEAKALLVQAQTEDEATYAKLVAPVLELIR